MEQYARSIGEVFGEVGSGEGGLSAKEAARRLQNGKNVLKEGRKKSKLALFFSQFKDLMTLILIAAACLSGALAFATGDMSETADTAILLFIILLNAVVGFLQQYRADRAIERLKELTKSTARVVRDGRLIAIDASELVVGDVVELSEGDRVPADCRVISAADFRADESALTGESRPVKKFDCTVQTPALSGRSNTVHMGTFCVRGNARCLVVATGMDTEMGKIADLLSKNAPSMSPLDRLIAKLGKIITAAVLSVAAVLFLGGLFAHRLSFLQNVMNAVAIAVAAIPEGMGAVVTVILAMGVKRMAGERAVIRKLSAVETLGSCSVICSDKTGTLTKNKMTVEEIATDFSVPQETYTGTRLQQKLLTCMRICHTVKGDRGSYVGDPTEIALVEFADRCRVNASFEAVGGVPFTSERKMMSVLARTDEGLRLYVKGGTGVILKKCTYVLKNGQKVPLSEGDSRMIIAKERAFSAAAMRVLAFAEGEREEEELTFLGLAAMLDPPKENAGEAVASCKRAGVRTVMITGDSAETAFAVASRLGIAETKGEVITGEEMDALGEKYAAEAEKYSVYARVSPRHKQEIVRALQASGEVVAMTGDGVNDAPALKAADIGVAMGSGTDVTKNAADMVITDDDFSTVVKAVEEGRNVFFNVKKTISFFLSTNLAEVLCVLIASLFLWRYDFLTSTQLLWINLITDSLPVLALGVERAEGAMLRPPVSDREIFSAPSLFRMLFFGCMQAAAVLGLFAFGLRYGNGVASTMAFLAMSLLELLHAFNVRGEDLPLRLKDHFSNKILLLTVFLGVVLNVLLVLVPLFRGMFGLSALSGAQWLMVTGCSLSVLLFGSLYRGTERLKKGFRMPKRYSPRRGSVQ